MAKNVTKGTYQHVTRSVKTPAKLLKAAQNVARAAEQLRQRQQMCKYAKLGRQMGFTGRTEQDIAAQFAAHVDEIHAAAVEEVDRSKVNQILADAGAYKKDILAFLADRINKDAAFVLTKINDFMSRPRNRKAKDYVDHVVAQRNIVTLPAATESVAA